MPKKLNKTELCVEEEVKIAINIALERFRISEDLLEYSFPSSFTSTQRAYIHKLCVNYGFKSFSKGKGVHRYVTVSKNNGSSNKSNSSTYILMVRNSKQQIQSLLQKFPLSVKERQELQQRTERNHMNEGLMKEIAKTTAGRLSNGVPQVPPCKSTPSEFTAFQETLPINTHKDNIIRMINDNKVLMVVGDTGSGKTTQIPQMILDDCQKNNKSCRIFCTQPRRLAVLTIAQRVAAERGEKIGETIGYQIRLESKVSPKTILTFCTNGVLLRTLMSGDQTISYVTHILIDEVHERDRFCDFLLLTLKELLPRMKHLRIILISANLNTQLFSNYFNNCPILSLPGKMYDVQDFFLEDILKWTGYMSSEMERKMLANARGNNSNMSLEEWCKWGNQPPNSQLSRTQTGNTNNNATQSFLISKSQHMGSNSSLSDAVFPEKKDAEELEDWLVQKLDDLLTDSWFSGRQDVLFQLLNVFINENVQVDYRHSELGVTALMVAAGRGFITAVERLINMGCNLHLRSNDDLKAIDWARKFEQSAIVELIEAYMEASESSDEDDTHLLKMSDDVQEEDRKLLSLYHSICDNDRVNLDLVTCLLSKIHALPQSGGILVFLPGYDDIMLLREKILENKQFAESSRYILYTLHSQMQSAEQKSIFKVPEQGVRKIILSTNIAETSITINDVVFVVDSGKVKMKSFDAISSVSSLKSQWISKSNVLQRSSRAGRCTAGKAYHLFSRVRYQHMGEYPVPEILRFPLQELCLHTKLLAPINCKIADFLAKAPESPAFLVVKNAVHHLKQIEALDPFEDLTELGHHLADLPIEPKYGKMILYSIVLKCLDPILTIACSLAYKDPFLLPSQSYQKKAVAMSRRRFSSGTFSDHMALLRAFQGWQKARSEGWEKSFCLKNFLSSPTMEMIFAMRTQLLGQLRAAGFVRARGNGDIRDVNYNSENWAVVKAALCAGMYPNVLKLDKETGTLSSINDRKVNFHSTSVLSPAPNEVGDNMHKSLPTEWVIFEEMIIGHRTFHARTCTVISPITAALFAGPSKLPNSVILEAENNVKAGIKLDEGATSASSNTEGWNSDSGEDEEKEGDNNKSHLNIDDMLKFSFEGGLSALVLQLRLKWHFLFLRRMKTPTRLWSTYDESSIRTLVTVLSNEEMSLGLQQPSGIGQRPRPMSNESTILSGGSKDPTTQVSSTSSMTLSLSNMVLLSTTFSVIASPSTAPLQMNAVIGDKNKNEENENLDKKIKSLKIESSNQIDKFNNITQTSFQASNQLTQQSTSQQKISKNSFFIVFATKVMFLNVSENRNIWPVTSYSDVVSKYLMEGKEVFFIFTVEGSGCFQGYARVHEIVNQFYVIEWIKMFNIQFSLCQSIFSSLFEKKLISTGDFQEIDSSTGEDLLKLWNKQPVSLSLPQNPLLLEPVNQESIWSSNPRKITQQNNLFKSNNTSTLSNGNIINMNNLQNNFNQLYAGQNNQNVNFFNRNSNLNNNFNQNNNQNLFNPFFSNDLSQSFTQFNTSFPQGNYNFYNSSK